MLKNYNEFMKVKYPQGEDFPEPDEGMKVSGIDNVKPLADEATPSVAAPFGHGTKPVIKAKNTEVKKSAPIKKESNLNESAAPEGCFMKNQHGEAFTPALHEVISYISKLNKSPKISERLVRGMRQHGSLSNFIDEVAKHNEGHAEIARMLDNPEMASKLVRRINENYKNFIKQHSMNESVDTPRGDEDDTLHTTDPTIPSPPAAGMSDPAAVPSTPMGVSANLGMQVPVNGMPPGSMALPSTQSPPAMDMGSEGFKLKIPGMAHNNIIKEMSKYDHMLGTMRQTCNECGLPIKPTM